MHHLNVRILAAALLLAACHNAGADSTNKNRSTRSDLRVAAIGCWKLTDERGQTLVGQRNWVPPIVRLDSTPVKRDDPTLRHMDRLDSTGHIMPLFLEPGINGVNEWDADSKSDTVRLHFNNAFSGSDVYLAMPMGVTHVDTMHGQASDFSDAGPQLTEIEPAVALRVPCPDTVNSTKDDF